MLKFEKTASRETFAEVRRTVSRPNDNESAMQPLNVKL